MTFKIDFIDKYHVELLQAVYGNNVKTEPAGDGENYNATIKGGTLVVTEDHVTIGAIDFHFSDYGNVIIY